MRVALGMVDLDDVPTGWIEHPPDGVATGDEQV
jgi:hypothetical protein